jgi:hypothetical protein
MNESNTSPLEPGHTPKGGKPVFIFYYVGVEDWIYLYPYPVFIEADDLEEAKEIFRKDYPDYKIWKIVY